MVGFRDSAANYRNGGLIIDGSPSRTATLATAGVGWTRSNDDLGAGFMVLADGSVTFTDSAGNVVTATFKANAQVPVLIRAIANTSAVDVLVFTP